MDSARKRPTQTLLRFFIAKLVIFIAANGNLALGQAQIPGPQFPTPNAEAFHVYEKYPQASSTGVPDITIPVYDFSYQGLSMPILLSYNANAVKPNTYPGWVGLGWTLVAGGSVTRQINGWPDDMNWVKDGFVEATGATNVGFFYNHGYLSPSNWYEKWSIHAAAQDLDPYTFDRHYWNFANTMRDYSPDAFQFSVGNISGTFYMHHDGTWKVRSSSKIKVVIENTDFTEYPVPPKPAWGSHPTFYYPNLRVLTRINLIDDKGIKYVFGEDAIEGSYDGNKTWYLSSIVFPNGKKVKYTYTAGDNMLLYQPEGHYGSMWHWVDQPTFPVYLSKIETELVKIVFSRSKESQTVNQHFKLDEIAIYDKLNNSRRLARYQFSYLDKPMDRLKLASLRRLGINDMEVSKFTMAYNATQFSGPISMLVGPFYKTDHWGYFSAINFATVNETQFKASRRADTANCRAELLDRIVYPTGGYTQYTWSPHDYSKSVSADRSSLVQHTAMQYAGGVRIKQINNYDKNGTRLGFKRYSYASGFTPTGESTAASSGILSYAPEEYYSHSAEYFMPDLSAAPSIGNTPHLLYSEVTEINSDGGSTNTIFSNFDNGSNNEYMDEPCLDFKNVNYNPVKQFASNAHERGLPLQVTTRTASFQLVHTKSIAYTRINKAANAVRAIDIFNNPNYTPFDIYGNPTVDEYYGWYGSAYLIYTNPYLPSTVVEKTYIDYDPLKFIATTASYIYDASNQNVTSVTTTNSKGETLTTEFRYPGDMVALGRDPTGVYARMVSHNEIAAVVERVNKKGATQISQQNTEFTEPFTNQFKPSQTSVKIGSGAVKTLDEYKSDAAGNLIRTNKDAGPNTTFIYGYGGNKPVAEVKNASDLESYYEGFEDSGAYGIAHTGHRYKEGPYVCNFSPPAGRPYKLSYWYRTSPNGAWAYASQIYSAPLTIRAGTSDDIDDVRICPVEAQMTTYTYEDSEISSVTDADNRSMYYEYDDAGRLRTVRDNEKNIVKSICYNYAGQTTGCPLTTVYFSDAQTKVFRKSDCEVGSLASPDPYTYTVPAGKYQSTLSKEDANQQALADLEITGQLRVNSIPGSCYAGTIYARMEIENIRTDVVPEYVHANVFLRFYSNSSCTSALAIPYDMTVVVDRHYRELEYSTEINMPVTFSVNANTTQVEWGQMAVAHLTGERFQFQYSVATYPGAIYLSSQTTGESYLW